MYFRKWLIILVVLDFILTQVCWGQEGFSFDKELFIESAKETKILKIGLVDCIVFALKNNSEIKIKKIEPLIDDGNIKVAKAEFEPSLTLDGSMGETKKQSANSTAFSPPISKTRTRELNVGLGGKFITGTEYDIDFINKKDISNATYRIINPYYESQAAITITQPLLEGFGITVNRADIIIASNNKVKSKENFKKEVIDVVSKTKELYYNYVLFLEQYKVAEVSLKRAKDLFALTKERSKQGLASNVDLLEAEASVAEREEALLAIEGQLKLAEDNLKYITNLVDDPQLWNAKIVPLDKPEFKVENVDLVESLKTSFQYRPDYEAAKIDLKNQDIQIKVKKNTLLPTVDLVGSFGLNGLNKKYAESLDDLSSGDYRDWSAGFKITIPLGNQEARGNYDKAKLMKEQLLISFARLEQAIILKVRDAVRGVDIAKRKVDASTKRLDTETKRYNAVEKRFREGLVSTHDMLDYQLYLATAEANYIQSLTSYNTALITLHKKEGTTLVRNDIKLEE